MAKDRDNGKNRAAFMPPEEPDQAVCAELGDLSPPIPPPEPIEATVTRLRREVKQMSAPYPQSLSEAKIDLLRNAIDSVGLLRSLEIILGANLARVMQKPFSVRMMKELEETTRLSRLLMKTAKANLADPSDT